MKMKEMRSDQAHIIQSSTKTKLENQQIKKYRSKDEKKERYQIKTKIEGSSYSSRNKRDVSKWDVMSQM
jgi:hypothetical protein